LKLEAPRTFYVALCITEFWISTLCHRPPSSPSLASSFPVHSQAFYLLTPCPLVYILFFPFPLQSTSTSYLCIGNTILISTVKLTRVFRKAVCSVYVEGESDITRRTSSFPQCDHRFTGTTYHPSASGRSHRALYESVFGHAEANASHNLGSTPISAPSPLEALNVCDLFHPRPALYSSRNP